MSSSPRASRCGTRCSRGLSPLRFARRTYLAFVAEILEYVHLGTGDPWGLGDTLTERVHDDLGLVFALVSVDIEGQL